MSAFQLGCLISAEVLLCVAAIGCESRKTTSDPLRAEADGLAKAYWDKKLTNCGSSSFYAVDNEGNLAGAQLVYIVEYKDLKYQVQSSPVGLIDGSTLGELSEADRLNGFQWKGSTNIVCSASRRAGSGAGANWSDWNTGCGFEGTQVNLFKKGGRWFYASPFASMAQAEPVDTFAPERASCQSVHQ